MKRIHLFSSILICWLGLAPFAQAQPAGFRHELLALLPDDFAVCVVMNDLRGHSARWEQSALLKAFRQSPVGKSLFSGPEMDQLLRWQSDVKRHFDLDWPTLRDDILGDTLVFTYSPGPKTKADERGLFLVHVRKPERLVQFIDRLNQAQKKSGELKALTALEYKGTTYYRRTEAAKTQFYFVKDSLAAVTSREDLLQGVIDQQIGRAHV